MPVTYTRKEDMPQKYEDTVRQMMESQAYRELAAAHLFGYGLRFVPSLKWLKFMTWHIREETEHYEAVTKMYQRFTGNSVEPLVNARLEKKPLPMAETWLELAMAQFLYDRGGFWQLQEYEDCTFLPYRDVIGKIIKEERGHQKLGEDIVVDLCQSQTVDEQKQEVFEKWLRIGMLSFGRPKTEGNEYAISVGLKKRDSGEVMQDFLDDIKPAVQKSGLSFPDPAKLEMELPPTLSWDF